MTAIAALIAAADPVAGGFRLTIPPGWQQGRTAYGGLSAALALAAAQRCESDLPPLRSAQIAFVGPLAGDVTVTATRLRRGRNAAFVRAEVGSDAGIGLAATFVFMADLPSAITHDARPPAPDAPPASDAKLYVGRDDQFFGRFEFFDPRRAQGAAEWLRWARLRERDGLEPAVELLAIGDALPPAAFKLAPGPTPISTLSWQLNLLTPAPLTADGWWLLHARADRAQSGHSSQRMTIWNADGAAVAEAIQGVAIFG